MKKLLMTTAIACSLGLHAQSQMELTATEVAREMMPGWNLGNTMEGAVTWGSTPAANFNNYGGLASETAWQSTRTTQAIIDYVKEQGFRSVRIPCAWVLGHISNPADYTIDATWMARVKEVVDYCINAGLYVLLNDHWDGGWLEEHITDTGQAQTRNKEVLKAIWTQIATEFRDYDEHLVFAGLNEPAVDDVAAVASLVEYEQVFIDAVRATGGNNEKRMLVVQGPSTDVEKTCEWLPDRMPQDPVGNKLAVEIHFYYPWQFWGMTEDKGWGNQFYYWGQGNHVSGSKHNATWGEESDMTALANNLKINFVDKGIPVINGEYGVIWRTVSSTVGSQENQEKHNASIKAYYKTMNQVCMERGIVPMVWDTNSTGTNQMTIINRQSLSVYNPYMLEGIHEAMEAVGISVSGIKAVSAGLSPAAGADVYYDLQGRRLDKVPQRAGLYIRAGRKVIVR